MDHLLAGGGFEECPSGGADLCEDGGLPCWGQGGVVSGEGEEARYVGGGGGGGGGVQTGVC